VETRVIVDTDAAKAARRALEVGEGADVWVGGHDDPALAEFAAEVGHRETPTNVVGHRP